MISPVEDAQQRPYAAPFASPIPVEATNLSHALRSEWTKIRTVRSTMWTLGIMLVLTVGIDLLMVWAITAQDADASSEPVLSPGLYGMMLGQVAVITLGVLVITSEYGTGMIRTTFTACPQRERVLTAKAIVFFALTFTVTTLASTVTALVNWSVLNGRTTPACCTDSGDVFAGVAATTTGAEWLGATVGVGLYVALLGLLALAAGTLLRHSAGAISAMLGVVLLPLISAVFMQAPGLYQVQEKLLEYSTPVALAALYHIQMTGDDQGEGQVTGLSQLGLLAVVTALALAGAYAVLAKRDV